MVIYIHGEITKNTESNVRESLAMANGEPIELHIDSIGGDLFAGLSIYNMLQSHDVNVFVDGTAGSVASIIALSGSKPPQIASTGSITIHNAHTDNVGGNQHDLQKIANSLAKYSEIVAGVYQKKTKLDVEQIVDLMNNETTFNATDAIATGFASDVYNRINVFAKINSNNINMTLLEKIKNSLNGETVENELVEETTETTTEETGGGEPFTPEQIEALRTLISELMAEQMTGQTEEIGNTIATVLNQIVSDSVPPQNAQPNVATPNATKDGVTAFYSKMNEIKNKTTK